MGFRHFWENPSLEQQVRVVPANNRQRDGEASILSPEEQNRSRHRSAHRGGLKLSTGTAAVRCVSVDPVLSGCVVQIWVESSTRLK